MAAVAGRAAASLGKAAMKSKALLKLGKSGLSKAGKGLKKMKRRKKYKNKNSLDDDYEDDDSEYEDNEEETVNEEGINKYILCVEILFFVVEIVLHRVFRAYEAYSYCLSKEASSFSAKANSSIIIMLTILTIIMFLIRYIIMTKSIRKSLIFGAIGYLAYIILIIHYYSAKKNAWACGEEEKLSFIFYFFLFFLSFIGLILQGFYRCR